MLDVVKGGLIVSCQALPDEPLHSPVIMAKMSLAAKTGGAVGIRANSLVDIKAIKNEIKLPVIGLVKREYSDSEIYITPTKVEVLELVESGCEMIALDATLRKRPNNEKLEDLVNLIHMNGRLAMADISTVEEAFNAKKIGFDCVSTTLSGYTSYSPKLKGPDFKLIKKLIKELHIPVIAEGRISTVEELKKISKMGPHAVVIGSAISRPQLITKCYVEAMKK
ncbi:MAG: nitronate monooxygenase family protein [Haloplasmataceae bacterium]|jgi:N-acylglucosamine-6-phosphate 2-epimerase|nr:nitronate monooxygenase family protein [Haloplasmataceae bacterium]